MPNHSFVTFIPKAIVPVIALAGMACAALLSVAEPATAKARTCGQKAADCAERCMARFKDDIAEQRSCGARTCNHQYKMCLNNSAGGPERPGADGGGRDGRTGPIVRDRPKRPPRGGSANLSTPASNPHDGILGTGVLGSGPALGNQGPAATGSPVGTAGAPTAPSAPPVIIR